MLQTSFRTSRALVVGLLLGLTWGLLETAERRAQARRVYDRIMLAGKDDNG